MKIYGNENMKRGIKVGEVKRSEFNDKNSAVGFIKERGMLGEFIAEMNVDVNKEYFIDTNPNNISMKCVECNGEKYWYGVNPYDEMLTVKLDSMIGFYKELPDIYNDKMFHWKRNKKYGSMECVVEDGIFEYHCIYKADGNAIVDVKYNVCDNRHRNRVTITTIEIEYASNEVIIYAIKSWKKEFKEIVKDA